MSDTENHEHNVDLKRYLVSLNNSAAAHNARIQRAAALNALADDDHTFSPHLWFESAPVILLFIVYFVVIVAGVFGNASLVLTICTQTSARFRNPLLVALCIADLMVTGISAPLTVLAMVMTHQRWSVANIVCKAIYFMQSMPVAASTISLFMLSLDRYATVKHPRLAQLRERRFLPIVLASGAWLGAVILCTPYLLAHNHRPSIAPTIHTAQYPNHYIVPPSLPPTTTTTTTTPPSTTPTLMLDPNPPASPGRITPLRPFHQLIVRSRFDTATSSTACAADLGSAGLHVWFVCVHTLFVFAIPAFGVLLNHLGVRKKLCALSLTARAAHGELPLPMPILRRPTHMIIVTGIANAGRAVDDQESCCSGDEDEEAPDKVVGMGGGTVGRQGDVGSAEEKRSMMADAKKRCNPRTPRSMRNSQINNHPATNRQPKKMPSSELPLPQTSTLRSRRRLANMLVAAALIFICCWSPYVVCLLCADLGASNVCPRIVAEYSLLLGYVHSALSPLLYWILNHNSLRQSTCGSFLKLSTIQKFMRTHLRVPAPPPPPSSTNEAALGPFNPCYIKARPQPPQYRPPASSYNLY